MKKAKLIGVASYLPEKIVSNFDLEVDYPQWDMTRLIDKIGIESRHIASEEDSASSMAVGAGIRLFDKLGLDPSEIDYLIFVSQSPDYLIPPTSSFVHQALGLEPHCAAIDILQGCSGFVTALGVAKGLIESNQSQNVLILTSDTYSKFVRSEDRTVRPIFGDGATATLVSSNFEKQGAYIGALTQGVDGSGAEQLIARGSGLIKSANHSGSQGNEKDSNSMVEGKLFMDGRGIFNFTLRIAEPVIDKVLSQAGLTKENIRYFIFHQANAFVLNNMREKLSLSEEQVPILMRDFGNTVSGTIPMVLEKLGTSRLVNQGDKLVLFGFGVGLAWAGTTLEY